MPRWDNPNCGFQKEHSFGWKKGQQGYSQKGKHWKVKDTSKHSKAVVKRYANGEKLGFQKNHLAFNKPGYRIKDTSKMKGHSGTGKRTEITKQKIREAAFKYSKKVDGVICPRIGKNEKKILDKLEKELNYKILRNQQICGYFPDGYISELNLIIEVDEKPKNKKKDIEREKILIKELNCIFLRIKDYN